MSQRDMSRAPRDSVRISSVERPGWSPAEGVPEPGDSVWCLEGEAEVVRILGRTSDGGRVLELRCDSQDKPFFASSSNVLVRAEEP